MACVARKPFANVVTQISAFNAALIEFGCYFVSRPRPNATTPLLCISYQDASKNLANAIEALTLLDQGNRMVERCRHYLQTLNTVITAIGESYPSLRRFDQILASKAEKEADYHAL